MSIELSRHFNELFSFLIFYLLNSIPLILFSMIYLTLITYLLTYLVTFYFTYIYLDRSYSILVTFILSATFNYKKYNYVLFVCSNYLIIFIFFYIHSLAYIYIYLILPIVIDMSLAP